MAPPQHPKCSDVKNERGQQPCDNNNMVAALNEGHVPDLMLAGLLAFFYSVLIRNLAISLHLYVHN